MNLKHNQQITLITGKGGVGRTTFAYSFAQALSRNKSTPSSIKNFLLLFHPPAKQFQPIPHTEIIELNGLMGQELFLKSALKIDQLVQFALGSPVVHKMREAIPSFQELGIFYQFLDLYRKNPQSKFVLDFPATGHTHALIALPEILLKIISTGPIATLLKEGQSILYNAHTTKAFVLTLAEELPIQESFELIELLRKHHISIGHLIVNRNIRLPSQSIPNEILLLNEHPIVQLLQKQLQANQLLKSNALNFSEIDQIHFPEIVAPFESIPELLTVEILKLFSPPSISSGEMK